ncbi:unnamed protein product [Symbiodinium natans]|uniref:Uncharacterized protein n=1 Tax=Symbiodinium natans TaxID=878477 RepID=A0A812S1C9_9DINO|nr:unnamed protein product [Symbiodinium natans]
MRLSSLRQAAKKPSSTTSCCSSCSLQVQLARLCPRLDMDARLRQALLEASCLPSTTEVQTIGREGGRKEGGTEATCAVAQARAQVSTNSYTGNAFHEGHTW